MGIKDNFSQAVKELWKKDGQDGSGDSSSARGGQPTELDKYLSMQNDGQEQGQADSGQGAQATPAPTQNYQFSQNAADGDLNSAGVPLETPYYRDPAPKSAQDGQAAQPAQAAQAAQSVASAGYGGTPGQGAPASGQGFGMGGLVTPPAMGGTGADGVNETNEVTVISKNTVIDGNIRSLANMQVAGDVKGNVETTRDIEMSGKVIGDVTCNNANMSSAAMQGNVILKGKMRMDRDTILIGDLTSQYADVNGRIRGKLEIGGKAELKRDAIVFGDINASTIAVTDGAIIQGYVNTTFLSKEDSRNVFPEAISLDNKAKGSAE